MAQKGVVTTQFPMGPIEELGLLKMDFLGLRTLTVLHNTLRLIKDSYGTEFTLEDIPFDDAKRSAKGLGGTINDLFVAGALAGAVAYHEARDAAPNRLRVAMPVSTRRAGTAGGNNFAIIAADSLSRACRASISRVRVGASRMRSPAAQAAACLSLSGAVYPCSAIVRK